MVHGLVGKSLVNSLGSVRFYGSDRNGSSSFRVGNSGPFLIKFLVSVISRVGP